MSFYWGLLINNSYTLLKCCFLAWSGFFLISSFSMGCRDPCRKLIDSTTQCELIKYKRREAVLEPAISLKTQDCCRRSDRLNLEHILTLLKLFFAYKSLSQSDNPTGYNGLPQTKTTPVVATQCVCEMLYCAISAKPRNRCIIALSTQTRWRWRCEL